MVIPPEPDPVMTNEPIQIAEPPLARFLFGDARVAWLWLIIRLYVGWEWTKAGWDKVHDPAWVGSSAGEAVRGFVAGALQKATGPHADVSGWYASFLSQVASPHAAAFSYVVAFGELLVGIALILGMFTGIAAFFGAFMNVNYLFSGTVSTNPLLLLLELFLILAWRNAGWLGVDRFLLPMVGTPWQRTRVGARRRTTEPPSTGSTVT